jgi:hypothetical protein
MKKLSDISYQLIAISLIVVVGLHSFNSFFNTHSHKLADGTIITHAHPYDHSSDSSPFKTHQHTATELVFLANLIHFLPAMVFFVVGLIIVYRERVRQFLQILSHQYAVGIPSLRGPPALSLWVY